MSGIEGFLNGLAGGIESQKDRAMRERELAALERVAASGPGIKGGGMPGGAGTAGGGGGRVGAGGDKVRYRDAIAGIESAGSGDYSAIGPTHPKLGRALGRYQIMEANIGPWSRAALGREVSADEFLKDPDIQDAVFDHQFGGYVDKYGPEGAAQAWLGGTGGVGKVNRTDSLGTSIGDYGRRFMSSIGGAPAPQGPGVKPETQSTVETPQPWGWFKKYMSGAQE